MKISLGDNNDGKQTRDSAWLGQFVFWTILVSFGFGGVEVLAFVIFGDYRIGAASAVTLGYGSCLLIAREQLRRGRIETAVTISCIGLLVGIVLVTLILPIAIPALTILPLVVVALALPYAQGREMRFLILASWGVGAFVAVFGEVLGPPSEIPTWFSKSFRIGSTMVALGLASLLLWQFTSRLKDTLTQARAFNAELQNEATERRRAEQELRESEQKFSIMFEKAPFAATLSRLPEGVILEVNEAFESAFGYTRQEITGKTSMELGINPDPEGRARIIAMLQTQGSAHGVELALRTKSGAASDFLVNIDVVDIGGQRYTLQTAQDITERKRADERQHFLTSASKALASSLDYETTLTTVAQLAVPKIADWCTVYLAAPDGPIQQVAMTHADPEKVKWARELQQRYLPNPNAPRGVAQVIRSGKAEFMPEIPTELLEPLRKDSEISKLLDELRLTGSMTVPLSLHGRTLGAISLVSAESRLRYTPEDLELAEELARHIAVAVENARLYHTAQQINQELEQRVSERTAELSQANALLNAMMDNVPDQIYFKDIHSRFIRNSRSQAKMMGLKDPAEVVGKSDTDFFPHARRAFDEEQEVMKSGQPLVDLEEYVVWPDRRVTWVSTTKVPLRNPEGQIIGIFGISRDITERKQAQESLRKAKDELETANKELESFSYSVSHDLRAPLRAIDGYSRILLEEYVSNLDEEGKRFFGVIRKEAQRMGILIDDLLAFSRLGRKEMRASRIDMQVLAGTVFDELVKENERERIEFQLGSLPSLRGDPTLIRQVWVNLISNALKFTSKKERAVIEVGAQQDSDEVIYHVRDNGAGFDMQYANKLFGVFQRLHRESEFEGTGVGLAIIQRVIHRHGGRVWAEAEVDKGAIFYFAFPIGGES